MNLSFFVTLFNRVDRLLISGVSIITISSAVLAWWTGLRPGICLEVILADLIDSDEGLFESVEFTSLVNYLMPTSATFVTFIKYLETYIFE